MTKSVNQSWSVSQKFRTRYGSTWADLDFFFKDKVSAESFKTDLINYSKKATKLGGATHRSDLSEKFDFEVRSKNIQLNRQEINRLRETLDDALVTVQRSYELGLYL